MTAPDLSAEERGVLIAAVRHFNAGELAEPRERYTKGELSAFRAGREYERKQTAATTPASVIERMAVQYGARQAAALRGDHEGVSAANLWLGIITGDQWHTIIADLRALRDAVTPTPPAPDVREECARVCDDYPQRDPAEDGNGYWAAKECAAAIRARGKR